MITAQIEPFSAVVDEAMPLLTLHWQMIALNKDKVPLRPRIEQYKFYEASGQLVVVTLRLSGKLIGYWSCLVGPELHYDTCLASRMDIFFVHPDYRSGPAAIILMRAVEKEMKRRGVVRWWAGEKLHTPVGRLFKAFGFEPVETYWMKWIGA